VILGQQLADALAREDQHRASWKGPRSPLEGIQYDWSAGEGDLLRLRPARADAQLDRFLDDRRTGPPKSIEEFRGALTTDDFYTLITYARRAVVQSLRREPRLILQRAVAALALIDPERVDSRDLSWAAALCSWGARRAAIAPEDVLQIARLIGNQAAIVTLRQLIDEHIDLADWGFGEVETPGGRGLADTSGLFGFHPTVDLLSAALRLAEMVEADRYAAATISIGDNLPPVWFGATRAGLRDELSRTVATVSVRSQPRAEYCPDPSTQMLLVYLSECASTRDAEALASAARHAAGQTHQAVTAREGRLLAVMIARSVVIGTEHLETAEELARFAAPLNSLLVRLEASPTDTPHVKSTASRWRHRHKAR
jgi:hypothetical protein